jgi:hypothetical protein
MKVVDLLLKCGANAMEADDDGHLPVFSAISQGHEDVAIHLLQKCTDSTNIMVIQSRQSTALHVACRFASVRVVNFLLQNGANMYATDALGKTPLHEVAGQRTLELREQVSEVLQSLAGEEARLEYIHRAHQTAATYTFSKHEELRKNSKSPQGLTLNYNYVTGTTLNSSSTGILSTTQTLAVYQTEPDIASQKLFPSLECQHPERNESSHIANLDSLWFNKREVEKLCAGLIPSTKNFENVKEEEVRVKPYFSASNQNHREVFDFPKDTEGHRQSVSARFWATLSSPSRVLDPPHIEVTGEQQKKAADGKSQGKRRKQKWIPLEIK